MVNVNIDEDVLVEMLMDRLREFWDPDTVTEELYQDYYENMAYGGAFDGMDFDVSAIVDNDWVNNLSVITEDEFEDYNIEDEEDDRIIASKEDHNGETYFLIYN